MGQAVMTSAAAFEWYPRWRAAHERLWNPQPPQPSKPKTRAYCPSQWRWQQMAPPCHWRTPMLIEVHSKAAVDDRELINRILSDLPTGAPSRAVLLKAIIAVTARHTGIAPSDITGPRRLAPIVRSRQIAVTLARELTQLSFPDIGRRFGNRDHTTVLWAYRRYTDIVRLCIRERKANGQKP